MTPLHPLELQLIALTARRQRINAEILRRRGHGGSIHAYRGDEFAAYRRRVRQLNGITTILWRRDPDRLVRLNIAYGLNLIRNRNGTRVPDTIARCSGVHVHPGHQLLGTSWCPGTGPQLFAPADVPSGAE